MIEVNTFEISHVRVDQYRGEVALSLVDFDDVRHTAWLRPHQLDQLINQLIEAREGMGK